MRGLVDMARRGLRVRRSLRGGTGVARRWAALWAGGVELGPGVALDAVIDREERRWRCRMRDERGLYNNGDYLWDVNGSHSIEVTTSSSYMKDEMEGN